MSHLVKLGLISEGINTWPLYVARECGCFEDEGVVLEATLTGSSVKQQEALIGGAFDIGFQQADHIVRAVERGSDLFIFMPQGHAPDLSLVAARGVRDIAELRNRTIAVDGARTGYALLLRRLLVQQGIVESEIVFKEFGGSVERYDALKSGAAAASLLNPPFDARLIGDGYALLASLNERYPTYPGPVMAARRAWAREHEQALSGFIRAYDAATGWLQNPANEARALSVLPPHLHIAQEAAVSALTSFRQRARPQLRLEGLRQVIDLVWEAKRYAHPKGVAEKYIDLSIMRRALAVPPASSKG